MIQKFAKLLVVMNIIPQIRIRSLLRASAFLTSTRPVPSHRHQHRLKTSRVFYNKPISNFDDLHFEDLESPETFPDWAYQPRDFFGYELVYRSKRSNARVGRIHTPHGVIDTPGYVAVATNGAIKGLDMRDADESGQQLVFCNSYHLMLQPGPEIIEGTFLSAS